MNQYVTGAIIKELREKNKMTQLQLAEKLGVSDKTVSNHAFRAHCEGVQNLGDGADIRQYRS